MKRNYIFSITVLFATLVCFKNNIGYAEDISENDVIKLEAEAHQKSIESKKLQAQAIQLNLELSKIDKTVISLAQKIQNNEGKLSSLENELKKLKENLSVKEKIFIRENNSLVHTLASLQNMSLNPSESVILQPLSPVDMIRSAILLRESVPFLNEKSSKLRVDLDSIYMQKQKIESTVAETKKQKTLLEKQQAEMRVLMKKKSDLRKDIEQKGAETQKIAEKLTSKAQNLRELLEELERQKEIARQKREEERRKIALQNKAQSTPHTVNTKTHADIKKQINGNNFVDAKGKLSPPVSGLKITDYGQTISNGVTSKGIVYKTRPNAQVTALYDGTVIFSGPFKGYGNIIIVEHGNGYLSLLAGLGNIDCDVGQALLVGEPIGTMPDGNNAKLYVEIRKDRHPINPSPWIAG